MLVDTDCAATIVTVGGQIPASRATTAWASSTRGSRNIETSTGPHWSPDGPYDGFNRPDYQDDPRVALVPMYDGTYTGTGADTSPSPGS
jgi:hypothetical protein